MSERFFSLRLFTAVWGIGYAVALYVNYPAFRYYPLVNLFSLEDLTDRTLGPAMSWYGWIAAGAIPALLIAALVPKRIGDRLPAATFWIVTAAMMLASWYREREWFLG